MTRYRGTGTPEPSGLGARHLLDDIRRTPDLPGAAGGPGSTSWRSVLPTDHITPVEEWPVMPVDIVSFWLKPSGFFDQNPSIDVAPSMTTDGDHCHTGAGAQERGQHGDHSHERL